MVGCWALGDDADRLDVLREATKADLMRGSFRDAIRLCLETAERVDGVANPQPELNDAMPSAGVAR